MLELFLQSRAIPFETADVVGQPLATADLADKVAPAVVQVLCYGAQKPSAVEPPDQSTPSGVSSSDVYAAKNLVTNYHAAWSRPNNVALAYMAGVYASSVDLYGKSVSVADVLAEKQRFASRWPLRYYAIQPGTLAASCQSSICSVSGVVDWFAKSQARNRSARGVASFDVAVDIARSVILSETGSVRKGESLRLNTCSPAGGISTAPVVAEAATRQPLGTHARREILLTPPWLRRTGAMAVQENTDIKMNGTFAVQIR